jgi:hypothetical protein
LQAGLGEKGDCRAVEALVTRVHGKPVERVEQITEGFDARSMTPEQRRAAIAEILEKHPGLAALIPRTANVQLRTVRCTGFVG